MQRRTIRSRCIIDKDSDISALDYASENFSEIEYVSSGNSSDVEDCENDMEDDRESSIPEFNVTELIDMANQLVANDDESGNVTSIDRRVSLQIQSVDEARDIILNHERTGSVNLGTSVNNEFANEGRSEGTLVEETIRTIPPFMATDELSNGIPPIGGTQRQPMWLELTGLATVVIFLIAVYRLVAALVSLSAFSENAINDVFEYVNYINERGYYDTNSNVSAGDTLIFKFSSIIKEEMPYLPDTIWMAVTLSSFSIYTLFTSSVVFTSMMFSAMCLSVCCIVRWKHLADFVMNVFETM